MRVGLVGKNQSHILTLITYEGSQLYGYSSLLKQSETGTIPPSEEKINYIWTGNKQKFDLNTLSLTNKTKETATRGYDST